MVKPGLGHNREEERGIIIVVALLVLLTLAGVALVATVRVRNEMGRSAVFVNQAQAAAEASASAYYALMVVEKLSVEEILRLDGRGFDESALDNLAAAPGACADCEIPRFDALLRVTGQTSVPPPSGAPGRYVKAALVVRTNIPASEGAGGGVPRKAQTLVRMDLVIGPLSTDL